MIEKERILKNNSGRLPSGVYDIIRIKNVAKPKEELQGFKDFVLAYLDNSELPYGDVKWKEVLPKKFVRFSEQLEDEDYGRDNMTAHISGMICDMQKVRQWEWYSSKLTSDGFEVVVTGEFHAIFQSILHHQGLPHASIFVEHNGIEYASDAMTDVLTYKSFDPETFELKRK